MPATKMKQYSAQKVYPMSMEKHDKHYKQIQCAHEHYTKNYSQQLPKCEENNELNIFKSIFQLSLGGQLENAVRTSIENMRNIEETNAFSIPCTHFWHSETLGSRFFLASAPYLIISLFVFCARSSNECGWLILKTLTGTANQRAVSRFLPSSC